VSANKFWEPIIRGDAVATLGYKTRLFLPEFREKAYEIFKIDKDNTVKGMALASWAGYYKNTKNKKVISDAKKPKTNKHD